jgi:hypothetical protein
MNTSNREGLKCLKYKKKKIKVLDGEVGKQGSKPKMGT